MGPTRHLLAKPVIAAVEGYAVAGGLELALWCDLRVASESAKFGVFCRRWGVPLIDGGTVRLPRTDRPQPRARHDPDRPRGRCARGLRLGPRQPAGAGGPGAAPRRRRWPRRSPRFPQTLHALRPPLVLRAVEPRDRRGAGQRGKVRPAGAAGRGPLRRRALRPGKGRGGNFGDI